MIVVPDAGSVGVSKAVNVPSGTCLDESCGLFSSLNLDDTKLNGMQADFDRLKTGGNRASLFSKENEAHSAFALTAHG